MTDTTLEWRTGPATWRQVKAPVLKSKRGNLFVKQGDSVYVFKELKAGAKVVSLELGMFVESGRITPDLHVFVGARDQPSAWEHAHPPARAAPPAKIAEKPLIPKAPIKQAEKKMDDDVPECAKTGDYHCEICKSKCPDQRALDNIDNCHVAIHDGTCPSDCPTCGFEFRRRELK